MLIENIKFQFSVATQLLDYHVATLTQEEYEWVRPQSQLYLYEKEGHWYADLPESESYDIGPASVAWTLWHITYWWEMVLDYSFGEGILEKEDVPVYRKVEEVRTHIQRLIARWNQVLNAVNDSDLARTDLTAFPFNGEVEFHKLASWLNLELTKNAAEIGYTRFDYATYMR